MKKKARQRATVKKEERKKRNYRVARHITLLKLKVIVLGFQPLHSILIISCR